MILFPYAKINLGLNIIGKRADGYHDIATVFYPIVGLTDVLEVVPAANAAETHLTCTGRPIDCPPEKNLVMKAYHALSNLCGKLPPVEIHLHKHIPDGAGLGGGSSDATAMLMALNEMFALDLDTTTLEDVATSLGADCPFFLHNRPLRAGGIGNEFREVNINPKGYHLLLVKPPVHVSTADAYAHVECRQPDCDVADIVSRPVPMWDGLLVNDFEPGVFALYPQLWAIKMQLLAAGADYAAMSGSGSALFGLFKSDKLAVEASRAFTDCDIFVLPL